MHVAKQKNEMTPHVLSETIEMQPHGVFVQNVNNAFIAAIVMSN